MTKLNSLKSKFKKGTTITGISAILAALIAIFHWGILARTLSSSEIGILSYLIIIVSLFNILCQFGLNEAIIHFQIVDRAKLSTILLTNLIICFAFYLLVFLVSPFSDLFIDTNGPNKFSSLLKLYSIVMFTHSISNHFMTIFQKNLDFLSSSILDLIPQISNIILFYSLMLSDNLNIQSTIIILLCSNILAAVAAYIWGSIKLYRPKLKDFHLTLIKRQVKYGLYITGSSFTNLIAGRLDRFFIGFYFGSGILGAYELAFRIMIKPIQLVNPILNKVTFPLLASFKENHKYVNKWYLSNIAIISFIVFPAYFLIYLYSEELIQIFFGQGWQQASSLLNIIWVLGLFIAIGNPLGVYLLALGKSKLELQLNLYRAALFIVIFCSLNDRFDIYTSVSIYIYAYIILSWPLDFYIRWIVSKMSPKIFFTNIFRSLLGSAISMLFSMFVFSFFDKPIPAHIRLFYGISSFTFAYILFTLFLNNKLLTSIIKVLFNARYNSKG